MHPSDLAHRCGFEILADAAPDADLSTAYFSDLLSDALAHCPKGALFGTIQSHLNALAVALHRGAPALLICHNRAVPDDLLRAAGEHHLALLRTPLDQYRAALAVAPFLPPLPHSSRGVPVISAPSQGPFSAQTERAAKAPGFTIPPTSPVSLSSLNSAAPPKP
ncbi:MAG: hypothetical protein SPK06_02410 [Kiritimatiellia bacterium]|nr:hypothetical protein [Kiritimatiellia bacterium]